MHKKTNERFIFFKTVVQYCCETETWKFGLQQVDKSKITTIKRPQRWHFKHQPIISVSAVRLNLLAFILRDNIL